MQVTFGMGPRAGCGSRWRAPSAAPSPLATRSRASSGAPPRRTAAVLQLEKCRGTPLIRKRPTPQENHRSIVKVLLYGPVGWQLLISEVTTYCQTRSDAASKVRNREPHTILLLHTPSLLDSAMQSVCERESERESAKARTRERGRERERGRGTETARARERERERVPGRRRT